MKKNVIVFGIIAGIIVTGWMNFFIASGNWMDMENGEIFGYTAMLIAFSMIFVGIKNIRDKHSGGVISFGKAFKAGLYITLIASTIYVIVWLIDYYVFVPDFMDKYAAHTIDKLKAGGATEIKIQEQTIQMEKFKEMYKNPVFVVLLTYVEILPLGLIVSLIAALILKRKPKAEPQAV